jgi:hypothetical protein
MMMMTHHSFPLEPKLPETELAGDVDFTDLESQRAVWERMKDSPIKETPLYCRNVDIEH